MIGDHNGHQRDLSSRGLVILTANLRNFEPLGVGLVNPLDRG
jgi:hypothetical protein